MRGTHAYLLLLVSERSRNVRPEELARRYQQGYRPCILASAFVQLFGLTYKVAQPFYSITEEDLASIAVGSMDWALTSYTQGSVSFATHYAILLKHELVNELRRQGSDRRRVNYLTVSIDVLEEGGIEPAAHDHEVRMIDLLDQIHQQLRHRADEKGARMLAYVALLQTDSFTNAEISAMLDLSIMTFSNYRKDLREILSRL